MTENVSLVHSVAELRAAVAGFRAAGERVALVPTMGALHAGHLSLVEAARRHAERVVVTIFVNPAQFGPSEDFAKYPRTLPEDLTQLARVTADLCFAPTVEEIYPRGFATRVEIDGPARVGLEDRFRPTHFCGVATIVAKLLNQAQADVAIFGEKDYQQLLVIKQLAQDLDIATQILAAPTMREEDGLAMSSRNVYLSVEERRTAPALYAALNEAMRAIAGGEAVEAVLEKTRASLEASGFVIDYVEARHAQTLAPLSGQREAPMRLLAAVRLGGVRLLDNIEGWG
ncbi:MAG TPA: pantoate--beta-alanine ligase [Methylocystis sp.]|nr:pantoate--beta-alanine ligase [Methylocystis sp.]